MMVTMYHADLMDEIVAPTQKGVHVKLKTNDLSSGTDFAEIVFKLQLNKIADPIALNFMIFDERGIMIIFEGKDSKDLSGIYTNNPALVATFRYLYERMT